MKDTTKNIQNWISNEQIDNQLNAMFENSSGFVAHELSINEAIEEINSLRNTIKMLLDKNIIDKISFHKRNGIWNLLNNMTTQLNQIQRHNYNLNQVRNSGNAIFSYIMSLKDQIEVIQLMDNTKGFIDYLTESKELTKVKRRYNQIVKDIGQAEITKNKLIESTNSLTGKINELQLKTNELRKNTQIVTNLNNQVTQLNNQVKTNAEDIESKRVTITSLHKSAKELEKIFSESNASVKDIIETSEKVVDDYKKDKQNEIDTFISSNRKKITDISTKNSELQKKINELLEGANAGRLYKSFHWRKRQLEKNQSWWFTGIIFINVIIVLFTLLIINGSELLGIKPLNPGSLDSAFYIKLFISLPLIFLDWFFIQQYNTRKDLIEKYTYKSVLSLSLLAYNEMIIDNQENNESLDFIRETVHQIYESPFEGKSVSKKELEILRNLAEKGLDHINGIAKETVSKTMS